MRKISLYVFFCILSFVLLTLPVFADNEDKRLNELNEDIAKLEKLLQETKDKEKSLSSQISYFDNQIKLTTLRIKENEDKILDLEDEIASLSARIARLEVSLNNISVILIGKIVKTYTKGNIPFFYFLFTADGFEQFLSRVKYLRLAQAHDKLLIQKVQDAKFTNEEEKQQREQKKEELAKLKKQLEISKADQAKQKKDKEYLLQVTKNDEKKYQEMLAAARAEQKAIESAIRSAVSLLKDGTPIKKGDKIALIGNTGAPYCSTGTHLHFEVRKNDDYQNPANYLKNVDVKYEDDRVGMMNFSGSWDWPVSSPKLTQEFGMSYWAKLGWYNGGPHTGIDIVSEDPVIRAVNDGTLYKGSSSCRGANMNFVAIDHGDGFYTWYWHVQ